MIDADPYSAREICDGTHRVQAKFTPEVFPWLKDDQLDYLHSLIAIDGVTRGWIGSCIEPGSDLEKIANSLNGDESDRLNRNFIQMAKIYLSYLAGKESLSGTSIHFIDSKPGSPPVKCVVNGKLRLFFVDLRLPDGTIAIVKIAACRKQNEDVVLREISSKPRANIR